jgi:hypothetical protein
MAKSYLVVEFDPEANTGNLVTIYGLSIDTKHYGPVARMYGDTVDLIQIARRNGVPQVPKVTK